MPGEHSVDGPAWHRSLVQNVLQHLGCSAPAFLTAPTTLAEVHSWNALRISISEAGPADYRQGLPIEIQDADSILFRGPGHSRSPMGSATGHVEADVEGAGNGGEGTGESEDCAHDSSESVWEDDAGPENSATRGPQTSSHRSGRTKRLAVAAADLDQGLAPDPLLPLRFQWDQPRPQRPWPRPRTPRMTCHPCPPLRRMEMPPWSPTTPWLTRPPARRPSRLPLLGPAGGPHL